MRLTPQDTTPEARARQVQAWRKMGSLRRLELALELSDEVRSVALDGLRARHPDASQAELSELLAASR